ncbi:hypothetical protein [Streptococcus catagoni]|uniref:hypothetical protein n=1 Tax=Streptococcus catagoni TaxID=2654874 RepID=UPI001F2AA71B|nr:hypothetical protein [Streptococcus catagoni]
MENFEPFSLAIASVDFHDKSGSKSRPILLLGLIENFSSLLRLPVNLLINQSTFNPNILKLLTG